MADTTIREALNGAVEMLRRQGLPTPRLDAEVLLAHVLRLNRTDLYIKQEQIISEQDASAYKSLIQRRAGREPAAYITGEKEFMSLSFLVNRNVLIPRPETEIMVEWIIEKVKQRPLKKPILLDVGTGSGAIAVSLACFLPGAKVWAVDISARALAAARANAQRMEAAERVTFIEGDLLSCIPEALASEVDIIAANLPYIPSDAIHGLMPDVAGFEPLIALDGGGDGLNLYRKLIPQAFRYLKPGGWVSMEMGPNQTEGMISLLSENNWRGEFRILQDYAGNDRFLAAQKKFKAD